MNKKYGIILTIIIVLGLSVGAYFIFANDDSSDDSNDNGNQVDSNGDDGNNDNGDGSGNGDSDDNTGDNVGDQGAGTGIDISEEKVTVTKNWGGGQAPQTKEVMYPVISGVADPVDANTPACPISNRKASGSIPLNEILDVFANLISLLPLSSVFGNELRFLPLVHL